MPVCAALGACAPGFDMVRVPGLYPTFQFAVTDYVNRCDPTRPTDVRVQAPDGTEVSVDGAAARSGTFTVQVGQQVNERFEIEVFRAGRSSTHHVRCLPADFPDWSSARTGTPQAQYYATVINDDGALNQPVVFDTNGVPVWWTERQAASLLTPLANGDLATVNTLAGMVERRLDGTVVRTVHVDGGLTDLHDAILLPNGNYALASFEVHPCDLTPWGEGPASCAFHRLQELAPDGTVVWSWRPETDIPLRETTPVWPTPGTGIPWSGPATASSSPSATSTRSTRSTTARRTWCGSSAGRPRRSGWT